MNNYIKVAVIIGFAIVVAMALNIYFSPMQTCKRELMERGNKDPDLACALRSR